MNRTADKVSPRGQSVASTRMLFHLSAKKILWGLGAIALVISSSAMAMFRNDSKTSTPFQAALNTKSNTNNLTPAVTDVTQIAIPITVQPSAAVPLSEGHPAAQKTTHLEVNKQTIPVPLNGTIHKEIQNSSGTTTIDFSSSSTMSGSSGSSSTMNIDVQSEGKTIVDKGGSVQ
jgi:hypothetical protein